MENFNWRKMSKITFPSGTSETEYLRFEENGTWTASDKEQFYVLTNTNPAYSVAMLNAKMHPVNDQDRRHMIASLQEWIQRNQDFLAKYGTQPQCRADAKDALKGIDRMEKEIARLKEMKLPQ